MNHPNAWTFSEENHKVIPESETAISARLRRAGDFNRGAGRHRRQQTLPYYPDALKMIPSPARIFATEDTPWALRANKLFYAVFAPLSLVLVIVAGLSLRWRAVHDLPIMMYFGFLMDRFGYIPYRDFFDFNLPGMHLAGLLIGRTVGYSDLGLRILDLGYLSAISVTTWFFLKKVGGKVAWAGTVLFGVSYLWYGPYLSLQREYFTILPLALAVLVAFSYHRRRYWLKPAVVGLLFGISTTIKLHSVIGFPLVLWFLVRDQKGSRGLSASSSPRVAQAIGGALVGFVVPLIMVFLYLWYHHALRPFWEIASNYWPLYTGLAVNHQTVFGFTRVLYLVERYASLGGHALWVMPAVAGFYISIYHSRLVPTQKRQVVLLGGMTVLYSLYPVAAGQFWSYHWLLFHYFILVVSSLCLVGQSPDINKLRRLFPVLALVFVIFLRIASPHQFLFQKKYLSEVPKGGKVDEIAAFLQANLRPGDMVQPVDWTDGAVHAMLISRAQIATRFVYAFSFYHHISSRYIKDLRREFIAGLHRAKPRFIIKMENGFPWVHGLDTTKDFADLDRFIAQYYTIAQEGNGYKIYERAR